MYSVLVVEDDPAAQELATAAFRRDADFYIVALVKTAEAALAVADVEHVDIVVLDDRLEGNTRGSAIVGDLRRLQPHAAIILWSSNPFGPIDADVDVSVSKDEVMELVPAARRLLAG